MGSTFVVGERNLVGKYNRVYSAGEVYVEEGDIGALYGAGEVTIERSQVKKVRVAGDLSVDKSKIDDINAVGELNFTGVTTSKRVTVRGVLNAECLECNHLIIPSKTDMKVSVDGKNHVDTSIKGFIKADLLENYADLNMDFEYDINSVVNGGNLITTNPIAFETFYSFGTVVCEEVNAEKVYIRPSAHSKIGLIVGAQIKISKYLELDKFLKNMPKKYFKKYYESIKKQEVNIMTLQSIEGDQIYLDHVNATMVSGINVVIGDLCMIDRVEYTESIKISPKAIVNEVVRV